MCGELSQYQKAGVKLLLNGQLSSPKEIAKACTVEEERTYMRDYIQGEQDELLGIGFDWIRDID